MKKRGILAWLLMLAMVLQFVPMTSVSAATTPNTNKRVVLYYGDWSVWGEAYYPKNLPADSLTYLNFAFLNFDASGNLIFADKDADTAKPLDDGQGWGDVTSGILANIQQLKLKHPNLKIGVSIGGWSQSSNFSNLAANATSRANFVNNIKKFLTYTNMDFVDIDWEYPTEVRQPDLVDNKNDQGTPYSTPADKQNFTTLMQDIKSGLNNLGAQNNKTYELSIAVPCVIDKLQSGYDIASVFNTVDFANLMSYDLRGAWNTTSGHQASLYTNPKDTESANAKLSIDDVCKWLVSQGAPKDKIVIGAAYYTRGWAKVDASKSPDPSLPGMFAPAAIANTDADGTPSRGANNQAPKTTGDSGRVGGVWPYYALSTLKNAGAVEYWDSVAHAPYLYNASTGAVYTYDNVRSVQDKAQYVIDNGYGGIIGWMASQDAVTSTPGTRDELTKAIFNKFYPTAPTVTGTFNARPIQTTVKITPFTNGTGGGFTIDVTNAETVNESNAVLSAVEATAKTMKFPQFVVTVGSNLKISGGDYRAGTCTINGNVLTADLSSVYDAKTIKPGVTYEFQINTTTVPTASDMKSIVLNQRFVAGSTLFGSQTIYGSGQTTPTPPVISGAANTNVVQGTSFDAKAGVTAVDYTGANLTSSIAVTGSVNTSVPGDYTLTYSVTDSNGLKTTITRVVTVTVAPNPTISGANDISILKNSNFDAMAGVTAKDYTNANITSSITVTGSVNTAVLGSYTLTYSVTDKNNHTTTVTRKVTVTDSVAIPTAGTITVDNANNSGSYTITATIPANTTATSYQILEGTTVVKSGSVTASTSAQTVTYAVTGKAVGTYSYKLVLTNSAGSATSSAVTVTVQQQSGAQPWSSNSVAYKVGDLVTYNGHTYKCIYAHTSNVAWTPDICFTLWTLVS